MAMSRLSVASIVCAVTLGLAPAKGDTNSVQGLITGADGKPVAHAEVRAERTDAAAKRIVTTTDANGHYKFAALPAGKYSITVVTDAGSVQAAGATATVSAPDGQLIRRFISAMPYQVKADFRGTKKASARSQYVWKPAETGSHLGGTWVKVSEVKDPSANPLQKLPNSDMSMVPALRVNSLNLR
jgi:carboxypeptidase family protein